VRNESWHPLIRILGLAILLQLLSCVAELIHYSVFANNGIGAPFLQGFGDLMNMASEIVLMFLCILVAKGWAITTSYLNDKHIILIVNAVMVLGYLALFIWDRVGNNPATTLYFYDSIPGIIVVVLRVGILGWFLWCLRATIRLESLPEKRSFYFIFGGGYTVWFVSLPILVLVAYLVSPTVRYRMITGMEIAVDFVALAALGFLLWPTRAAKYFTIRASPQLLQVKDGGYGTAQEQVNSL